MYTKYRIYLPTCYKNFHLNLDVLLHYLVELNKKNQCRTSREFSATTDGLLAQETKLWRLTSYLAADLMSSGKVEAEWRTNTADYIGFCVHNQPLVALQSLLIIVMSYSGFLARK